MIVCPSVYAAPDKPIIIRFATYQGPEYADHYMATTAWVNTINEKGKGKVKVEFFPSETLLKAKETFTGLMGGAAEAVSVTMSYWHGNFPLSQGLSLGTAFGEDMERYYRALKPGSPLSKFLKDEFAKKNIYMMFSVADNRDYLWTKKKYPVRKPEDAKGLKVRTNGIIQSQVAKILKAGSVSMPSGEIFTAIQRGTIDAIISPTATIVSRGLKEEIAWRTNYAFDNFGPYIIALRKDYWDKLPDDVRAVLTEAEKACYEVEYRESMKATEASIKDLKKSMEFIDLTPESLAAFDKLIKPIEDWWVGQKEIGDPGKKLLELIRQAK
jgi:TRAP-type C4-dicarboxylate transport system substrate-binding protein